MVSERRAEALQAEEASKRRRPSLMNMMKASPGGETLEEGLAAVFDCLKTDKLPDAIAWCKKMGADTVADLENDDRKELIAYLALPPIKARKLAAAFERFDSSGVSRTLSARLTTLPEEGAERMALLQALLDSWHSRRWVLQHELGRGGGGVVLRATDSRLTAAAIKFRLVSTDSHEKVEREAAILQRVRHPHVCAVEEYNYFEAVGLFAVVMELLEGTLQQRLEAQPAGKLGQHEVARITFQLLQALQHVHEKGIIHRDVKVCMQRSACLY